MMQFLVQEYKSISHRLLISSHHLVRILFVHTLFFREASDVRTRSTLVYLQTGQLNDLYQPTKISWSLADTHTPKSGLTRQSRQD